MASPRPISIYHTGDPWPRPTGPEAYRIPKEARPSYDHPIAAVWRELGRRVYEYLDSVGIKWTTIDPVRFAQVEKEVSPLFLWVGVMPGTLFRDDAKDAAVECKKILAEFQITDVEISFRESVFTRSAGPQLLDYPSFLDLTADIRGPFTPALGLPIAARATAYFEGMGGVYLCEGGESKRVFLLTARHVVLPPSTERNDLYVCKNNNSPRREVILFGRKSYQDTLNSTVDKMKRQALMVDHYKGVLKHLEERIEREEKDEARKKGEDDEQAEARKKAMAEKRKRAEDLIKETENSVVAIKQFHGEITKDWSDVSQRVLGHIVHPPPISVGTGFNRFTEDWALIELDEEKINWESFKGNVIDLGPKFPFHEFIEKMYSQPWDCTTSEYPLDNLLQLRDIVKEGELCNSIILDANGEECIAVIKNGNATNLTMGRASSIESFVREYDGYDIFSTFMAVAVYSYSDRFKDGAFSAPGDSGSIIADGKGRIVGLLIGGTGKADSTDVTYASPYHWIDERVKEAFPKAHLYQTKY